MSARVRACETVWQMLCCHGYDRTWVLTESGTLCFRGNRTKISVVGVVLKLSWSRITASYLPDNICEAACLEPFELTAWIFSGTGTSHLGVAREHYTNPVTWHSRKHAQWLLYVRAAVTLWRFAVCLPSRAVLKASPLYGATPVDMRGPKKLLFIRFCV